MVVQVKRVALARRTSLGRGKITRKAPIRRGRKRSAYATRERDTQRMLFVKTLPCAVRDGVPWATHHTPCSSVVEADHAGARGVGRKASDDTVIPLCSQHHRERTDHSGTFKHATQAELREWLSKQIAETRGLYECAREDTSDVY